MGLTRLRVFVSGLMIKLRQGQVWKSGGQFLRIVHLERLEVKYKLLTDLASGRGTHHHVTKKEFCRLIKGASLVDEKLEARAEADGEN
jgi:hypothetical protein